MSWGKLLQPDLVLHGPVLQITPETLQQHQLKGLVLDVDETLVPMRASQASEELLPWVQEIRQVANIWLVSNNISEGRIGRIAKALEVPYLLGAGKPSRRKLRRAVEAMQLPVEQVAMVGDRLFTDVLAGNRLGMFTILVEPMVFEDVVKRSRTFAFEVWLSRLLGATLTTPNSADASQE
ncbi:MAG TPA: YqeG family HAD IIIA-type phosphatase [Leptolyngbyaceae cyanobacterium M33_DOE_097]|uniref:YqeG family HAD IIIA-type phosphatase n=1 Tax=Oscillatoriales cyanobacterium SpSt-418 TaxID=2282169 RepID=A0A7C3PCT5_9CYAN|nr:YqeG family HAD IIIA-type phosphatase [Leptolyngbyaceae cyanobacterium M33_DOE_097]